MSDGANSFNTDSERQLTKFSWQLLLLPEYFQKDCCDDKTFFFITRLKYRNVIKSYVEDEKSNVFSKCFILLSFSVQIINKLLTTQFNIHHYRLL